MRLLQAVNRRHVLLFVFVAFAFVVWPNHAIAQIHEVVVGVTPTCPYGIKACWAGAYHALGRIDGVESVATTPDAYNCTASLRLKPQALPDPDGWAAAFTAKVGKAYVFRGVEVTVEGSVEKDGDAPTLRVPGIPQPIALTPLEHKLQWNFKKAASRQPEPDERDALAQLVLKAKNAGKSAFKVQVTGPFTRTERGYSLEVREFIASDPQQSAPE
jgi:galactose oxidase